MAPPLPPPLPAPAAVLSATISPDSAAAMAAPSTSKKGQGNKKGKGPTQKTKIPTSGAALPAAALRPAAASSSPAIPSTSSGGTPPLAPRAYAQVADAPPVRCHTICPDCRLRYHPWGPRSLPLADQEAQRPLPPGACLTLYRNIRAGIGKGGRAHGHCSSLQDVRQGCIFPCIGGRRSGGGREGPGGEGGVFIPLELLEDLGVRVVLTSVPPFLPKAALLPALSTLGKHISVLSPLPLGCKDPALCHILSFRRQVQIQVSPAERRSRGPSWCPIRGPITGSTIRWGTPGVYSAGQWDMSGGTAPWPGLEGHPGPPRGRRPCHRR
ncbi:hypothetical protein G0U57_018278 [Chelydra serpentina]|uniref:Uncharacterized protein n=1 Tax=Chelydra serpentina TaxID=8475 RepID=A0A8T1S5M9_CHESE|nr:hypothetical protein G0U57_018278 [Chelydra serpentina]